MSTDNDFGYLDVSFLSDEPIQKQTTLETRLALLESRMNEIRKIYIPLLDKLAEQPDKDFIKWPGRKDILDQYKSKLINLTSNQ